MGGGESSFEKRKLLVEIVFAGDGDERGCWPAVSD